MDELADSIAKQDTTHGHGAAKSQTLIADAGSNKTWLIELDAANSVLNIRQVDNAGATVAAEGLISLDLGDLTALGLANVSAKFRVLQWKDASTCTTYKAGFLMTEPETVV